MNMIIFLILGFIVGLIGVYINDFYIHKINHNIWIVIIGKLLFYFGWFTFGYCLGQILLVE